MKQIRLLCSLLLLGCTSASAIAEEVPYFESKVRAILKAHCWQCHGEEKEVKGGLDARLVRFLVAGGESGAAIEPGRHADSLLYQRIASGEMPPGAKRLTEDEVNVIKQWIDAGAKTERPEPKRIPREGHWSEQERKHWAFQPIQRPPLPQVSDKSLLRSPIDAFLLSRLEAKGLSFGEAADRATLARRLSFDLLGLPPAMETLAQFKNNANVDAYDRMVESMLSSPAYGERWARHWLDVAGYADSNGVTKKDIVRPWAFKYRDYVIRSINANKSWKQFIVEQIAGDELVGTSLNNMTPSQAQQLIATGFLRMSPDGTEGKVADADVARNQAVAEVIKVFSTSLLGLSVGCAQCHSHRYDPISHTDYYRLRALFEPAYDWKNWRIPSARLISQWTDKTRARAAAVDAEVRELTTKRDKELDAAADQAVEARIAKLPAKVQGEARAARSTPEKDRNKEQKALIEKHPFLKVNRNSLQEIDGGLKAKVEKKWAPLISAAQAKRPPRDQLMCLTEIKGKVPKTFRFDRGDFKQPQEEVLPGELSIINTGALAISVNNPKLPSTGRRLAYAEHLTNGKHPLVARVLVNRFWMHHFGKGLVATPGDFGVQGEKPSHPLLLDWLAAEFMESGWDLKHLHRLILTSTAYRQSATRRRELEAVDPDNRLLGRMAVRRLEAEVIRDSLLAVSSELSTQMYGKPSPVSLDSVGQQVIVSANQYDPSGRLLRNIAPLGEERVRRTIYVQVRRSMPLGVLVPFDPPILKPNCTVRTSATDAPQSLMMLNDPFVIERARSLAKRVTAESSSSHRSRFEFAWKLVMGKPATETEIHDGVEFLKVQTETLRKNSKTTQMDNELSALTHLCHALISSNGFLYVD